ncbi:DNA recombination protein RmuC [Anaerovibrio sp. JC8]|uniref:DNA recombination protein RmuC n=1 Tax=Anaerovibrio sp. JC8 TaxID=1240085 RepID=UPI000A0C3BC4|nr:DNA recombination protein RmuC [Anaerovibrio sp. JC8]ORT99850.1 DNA recombination protein RmuC [Anaerovibrio sp. JC8]
METSYIIIVLLLIVVGLLVSLVMKKPDNSHAEQVLWNMQKALGDSQQMTKEDICRNIMQLDNANSQNLKEIKDIVDRGLVSVRNETEKGIASVRGDLDKNLKEIKGVVDEQLQTVLEKRITASFKTVSTQLEQVYKGLGEMQALASDVGSLKQVLSGVKTRGVLGEYQLKSILVEILTTEQFEENVETVPNSGKRVEFAIKLPGMDGETVYLPIDAKFPMDSYNHLLEAQDTGDKALIDQAQKELENRLDGEAKDISTKYLAPPHTTSFAIMFLPIEGLYAHAVDSGMVERLQHKYKVNIAGPSTMAAMLNSLQMGFRTLAIQKRSSEVWKTLGEVKSEFIKYNAAMDALHKQFGQVTTKFDALVNTRTNVLMRKFRDVEAMPELEDNQDE